MKPQDRTRAISKSKLGCVAKMVLIVIADHYGARDCSWPSIDLIAERAGVTDRTVHATVATLDSAGLLACDKRHGCSTTYKINFAGLDAYVPAAKPMRNPRSGFAPEAASPPKPARPTPEAASKIPPKQLRSTPEAASPEAVQEAGAEEAVTGSGQVPLAGTGLSLTDAALVWNALRRHLRKPDAWKLTTGRQKSLKARIHDEGARTLIDLGEWLVSSQHERAQLLRERGDLDTVLRPENCSRYVAMMRTEQEAPAHMAPRSQAMSFAERELAAVQARLAENEAFDRKMEADRAAKIAAKAAERSARQPNLTLLEAVK